MKQFWYIFTIPLMVAFVAFITLKSVWEYERQQEILLLREEYYAAQARLYAEWPDNEAAHSYFWYKWRDVVTRWLDEFPCDYVHAPQFVRWEGEWMTYEQWINRKSDGRVMVTKKENFKLPGC